MILITPENYSNYFVIEKLNITHRFNYTEFGTIKNTAGSNNFVLSVKQWIERTGAIGITAKAGRYDRRY